MLCECVVLVWMEVLIIFVCVVDYGVEDYEYDVVFQYFFRMEVVFFMVVVVNIQVWNCIVVVMCFVLQVLVVVVVEEV